LLSTPLSDALEDVRKFAGGSLTETEASDLSKKPTISRRSLIPGSETPQRSTAPRYKGGNSGISSNSLAGAPQTIVSGLN
jgi:hypothetical protein